MRDYRTAPVSEPMKALLAFVEKTTRNSRQLTAEDVQKVRDAGWTDEAIYDAISVCALFQFYNTWVDASGVSPLADYTPSGQRLAAQGYAPAAEKVGS
jgi:alkylhydroperoxidase family enzyme